MQNEIRAAADVPTLFATLGGKKGDELSENKIRAAKWQKRPHHALIVAGRVKKRNLRQESDTMRLPLQSLLTDVQVKKRNLRKESDTEQNKIAAESV